MTHLDRFITYVLTHQWLFIEITVALILATVLFWLFSHLRQESSPEKTTEESLKDIEEALRRVLETTSISLPTAAQAADLIHDDDLEAALQNLNAPSPAVGSSATGATTPGSAITNTSMPGSNTKPSGSATVGSVPLSGTPSSQPNAGGVTGGAIGSAPLAGGNPSVPAGQVAASADPAELAKLKSELENKQRKQDELEKSLNATRDELQKAKDANAAAQAAGQGNATNTDEIQKRLKELEARLGEYEIIEDDIANLSLYKEENIRLKTELEKMKGRGTPDSVMTPTPPAAVAPPSTPTDVTAEGTSPAKIDADKLLQEFDNMPKADATPKEGEQKDSGEKLIEEFENFMKGTNS